MVPTICNHVAEFRNKLDQLDQYLGGLATVGELAGAELLIRLDKAARSLELSKKKLAKTAAPKGA